MKITHGGMSLLVKLHTYITQGNIIKEEMSTQIVTIFWSIIESIEVIKKMKEILKTEKEIVFLLSYFRALLK